MTEPRNLIRRARPARGEPDATRKRLVAAAALEFERHGYFGTDTNRIARAAGYAPGTFYKHFGDKLDAFLAVYDDWVRTEWEAIGALVQEPGDRRARVERIIDLVVEHHRRWRGFRASLRALVATEPKARHHHRTARKHQLEQFRRLGPEYADATRAGVLMLLIERVCDAIADGELDALGLSEAAATRRLVDAVLGAGGV